MNRDDENPTVDLGPGARKLPTGSRAAQTASPGGPSQAQGGEGASQGADVTASLVAPPVLPRRAATEDDMPPARPSMTLTGDAEPFHGGGGAGGGGAEPHLHAQPTQQLSRGGHDSRMESRFSTTTTPAEAMRYEEIDRMRLFLLISVILAIAAVAAVTMLEGDPLAYKVVIAGASLVCVGAGVLWKSISNPAHYTLTKITAGATVVAISAYGGVYYWGLASPAVAMILYGIYFFSLGLDVRVRLFQYVLCAFLHAGMSIAIISGAMEDRSILKIGHLSTQGQIVVCFSVQFLYFIAFITARWSRRSTIAALHRLEQAVRSVAQREALLAEVRAELDRAIKVGGPGRYTDQIVGSFRLGVLIGRGGMGEVYEARHVSNGSDAAVKLLGAGTLGDEQHLRRFLREAEHAAQLENPHVVRIIEVGATGGELPYIAMERLRGTDLAHQLRRFRRLSLEQVNQLVHQLALGLESARLANIVHRDLKPQNVFLSEVSTGVKIWKILDFGVSTRGGNSGTLTRGNIVGTPAYMSPEQARGEGVDHRADVYSLAAIVYRCATGHPAFTGKDVPTTLYDVVYRVPTQPSMLAQLPSDIDRVLAIGLAKAASDRFNSALEFAEWFVAAIGTGLSQEQRRRADAYIERHPWGTRPAADI